MKKQWNDPKLMGLGVENTKEEADTLEGEKHIFKCQYCGAKFATSWDRNKHEKDCALNPAHKPTNPLPDLEEGPVIPLS